jgi:ribosome-associated toxin RatA of RatAB toxin-antitoxin module
VNIHFNDTRPAEASAETLFDVITDYANYPDFNSALIHVDVVKKDESGAEFVADRKTKMASRFAHSISTGTTATSSSNERTKALTGPRGGRSNPSMPTTAP